MFHADHLIEHPIILIDHAVGLIHEDQDGHNLVPQTVENQLQTLQEADGWDGRSCRSPGRGHQWLTAGLDAWPVYRLG